MSISVQPKRSFTSLLDLGSKNKKGPEEGTGELKVDEVPELIQLTKDVIVLLDRYKDNLEPIPALIQELMNFGKTFTKIDVKINEYDTMHFMTPTHLKEANACLSLLKETLLNIQREVNQYAEHQKPDKLTNKVWMMFNQSTIVKNFVQFQYQVKEHCDHLLTNFLPILNTIVSSVTEKDKMAQSIHSLSATDKERICATIMKEQYIMKLYLPKGSSRSGAPHGMPTKSPMTSEPPAAAVDTIQITKQLASASVSGASTPPPGETSGKSDKDPEMITLKKQSSASRFLIEQKASKSSVHHEASDLKEEEKPKEEKISVIRNLSFNLFDKKSRNNSFSTVDGAKSTGAGPKRHEDPEFDVLPDYYHIKWLSVLPQIWRDFPNLTFGQIKYIYLSQNFFLNYHNDMYFINNKTVDEVYKLQQTLENAKEIACFTQEDFEFVASTISGNQNLTMRQLIPLLHQRFQGTREFTFLTVSEKLWMLMLLLTYFI